MTITVTHSELVNLAGIWLSKRCSVVVTELVSGGETADVMGWQGTYSTLIEVKVTRADFTRDKKKIFRKNQALGMGQYRWMCCPAGMIKAEELNPKWGLLWAHDKILKEIWQPMTQLDHNTTGEMSTLLSCVKRLGHKHLTAREDGVSLRVRAYNYETKNTAALILGSEK